MPFFRYLLVLSLFSFQVLGEEDHNEEHSEVHDVMAYVLDPAARGIWNFSGSYITEDGEFRLEPTTDEGWEKIMQSAKVISETSYLLSLPSRSEGRPLWLSFSSSLKIVGEKAFEAAEAKDTEELFKVGAEIYQVCVACHNAYWIKN